MNSRLALLGILVALLAACNQETDYSPAVAPRDEAISLHEIKPAIEADRILADITELSSDAYGGREPMSRGEAMTLDYIEMQFRNMGLRPLFREEYRQPVDLVSIEVRPANAQMTFHLNGKDRWIAHNQEMVIRTSRAVPESRVQRSETVFVGYGIVAPEYNWNDYANVDVKGKTVLILINDPGFATQDPELFRGNTMTYYGRWTYKYEEAARQGAAAAVIIHDTGPAAYGWDVVRNSWTGPQFHLARPDNDMNRVAIESWVQKAVAEEIVAAAGYELAEMEKRALLPEFDAVPLGSTMDALVQNDIVRNQSYNIGALLPGGKRPDELFIYTAHWDHLGTSTPSEAGTDGIYNGAVDNASGIAALLELARSFAALPRAPERSVGFLAVTAEESGLLGSALYADQPAVPMQQTVAGINIDSMQVYGPTRDVIVVGYGSSQLEDILIEKAALQNRVVRPEEFPERGGYYRSDHFNLARKGVPMLYAKGGWEHTELGPGYITSKNDEYLKNRYHAPADEVMGDWDLRGLVQDVELLFAIGLEVADSEAWPNWYEGHEFRAIRDNSRGTETN